MSLLGPLGPAFLCYEVQFVAIKARRDAGAAETAISRMISLGCFFDPQQYDDLLEVRIAHLIHSDEFHRPLAGAFAGERLEHERCGERAVDLDGHTLGGFRHQMTTAEDTFEPLEKQFYLPAVSANQGYQLSFDFQIGGQQQCLAVHFHANHADRLALPMVAEFDFPLPGDARSPVLLGQGKLFDHFHAWLVADPDDMGGSDLFQLAEKSVFEPVIAVGDDDFSLLDELAQCLAFTGVSRRDERIASTLAQHGELQMQLGGMPKSMRLK